MAKVIGYANGEPIYDEAEEVVSEATKPDIRPERFEWKEGDLVFDSKDD